jgi:LacI family gluconate utilization system Gnt-I transcriptional repressor
MKRAAQKKGKDRAAWAQHDMPTMDDVARLSGVSQMTVSRAFLDGASIRRDTRERVLNVATQIGYYHNRAASYLASRRTRAFGIILPTLQDSVYLPFINAAREVFERHGSDFVLQTINYTKEREPQAIGALLSQRVQSILLPTIGHTRKSLELFPSMPVPVIEFGNISKRPIHFGVGHSDVEAGYVATRRLIETGRRKIAIVCGYVRRTTNARDRLAGYRRAHRQAGLEIAPDRVMQVDHDVDAGLRALENLMERGTFDGLVVAGEIWSSVILLGLLKQGVRIPRDVAVVGVGMVDLGRYLPVPLTYIDLPRAETGTRAAELAIALSRDGDVENPIIKLPVRLVESASG